jgi:uncharacterized protein DUF4279
VRRTRKRGRSGITAKKRQRLGAFTAGAAFRIYGIGLDIDSVTRELGVSPDHKHRQGELDRGGKPYTHDMWSLASPLRRSRDLQVHLTWLAERILPHHRYISNLQERFKVDMYCWKNCYTEQSSLVLSASALRTFTQLNINLEVGLLCLPPESATEPTPA